MVLRVEGSAGSAWTTWAVVSGGREGPVTGRVGLPWTRTVSVPRGAAGDAASFSLSVADRAAGAVLACSIEVDGRRVAADRAPNGATCTADLREP